MKGSDYYVGWKEDIPQRNKKAIRSFLIPVLIILPILAIVLVYFLRPFNDHYFEFGNVQEFQGTFFDSPEPLLMLDDGQLPDGVSTSALLLGYGKFGAGGIISEMEEQVGDLDRKTIRIRGTLISGDGRSLIELTKGPESLIEIVGEGRNSRASPVLWEAKLQGEIVDPKCWFGVMKPGEGKVHASCAIRCISGGIPPVLRVADEEGYQYYILKKEDGSDINQEILPFVAKEVVLQGQCYRQHDWNYLQVGLKSITVVQ